MYKICTLVKQEGEHPRDFERNDKSTFRPVIIVCGISRHYGNTETGKTLEQNVIFQTVTLYPQGIKDAFHST